MNAAQVHSVIAAGAADPRRVARWASDPAAMRALGIELGGLDLGALRGFSGLAMKVRHNGLRDAWRWTFRLLDVAGIEIELFADFALSVAERGCGLAAGDEARARDLLAFIADWPGGRQFAGLLLWDLVRHEQALFELARAEPPVPAAATQPKPTPDAIAHVRGLIELHEMRYDPIEVIAALRARDPVLTGLATGRRLFAYWRPHGDATIQRVELDEFGFTALQAADGHRSVAELLTALGLLRRPPARVLPLLAQLGAAGLLAFVRRNP
jgi:hypothetical protein